MAGVVNSIRLGVLVSGNGTNLQALIDAIAEGGLRAKITVVVSNKPGVGALERAKQAGIPCAVVEPQLYLDRQEYDAAAAQELRKQDAELIVLAGYMRILTPEFLKHFPDRVLNLHPALLPDDPGKEEVRLPDGSISRVFRGLNVIAEALASGARWTGCTVHVATAYLDRGAVIKRQPVPILPGDTVKSLHARIQEAEHKLLPQAVSEWAARLTKQANVISRPKAEKSAFPAAGGNTED